MKFLDHLTQTRLGTSNRKAALGIIELLVPLCFRSSCRSVVRCITNFGNGALVAGDAAMSSIDNETVRSPLLSAIRRHWVLFLVEGIVLVVFGAIAIVRPDIAGLAFTILLGWLF